jgi:hypothetical protein
MLTPMTGLPLALEEATAALPPLPLAAVLLDTVLLAAAALLLPPVAAALVVAWPPVPTVEASPPPPGPTAALPPSPPSPSGSMPWTQAHSPAKARVARVEVRRAFIIVIVMVLKKESARSRTDHQAVFR